jgi:hypothetical protein
VIKFEDVRDAEAAGLLGDGAVRKHGMPRRQRMRAWMMRWMWMMLLGELVKGRQMMRMDVVIGVVTRSRRAAGTESLKKPGREGVGGVWEGEGVTGRCRRSQTGEHVLQVMRML